MKKGDILRKGSKFYRIYDFSTGKKDIVCNRIIYNFKKEFLTISHDYTFIDINDVYNNVYEIIKPEDSKSQLEIIKRKYKLLKLGKNKS